MATTGDAPLERLARELSSLARDLPTERTPEAVMRRITRTAVELDGADFACITLRVGRRHLETRAATDELALRVDQAQYDTDEGPCLDSIRAQRTVRCDDLAQDPRWPRFTQQVLDLGLRSFLSLELVNATSSLGALNLYARRPAAFTPASEAVAVLLASYASVAVGHHLKVANLRSALGVRDLVGQAKGILMERYGIDSGAAFSLLATASQHHNHKLTDLASHLIATGELLAVDGTPEPRRSADGSPTP